MTPPARDEQTANELAEGTEPRPFSTSEDAPFDREPRQVPPVAPSASGADTWDQVDESAEADGQVDQGDYGNPREPIHDLGQ